MASKKLSPEQELLSQLADDFESGKIKWGQNPPTGADFHCVSTALDCDEHSLEALYHFGEVMKLRPRRAVEAVYRWNDKKGRTVAQVVKGLRKAAAVRPSA